jgi:hypothetical protein
LNSYPLGDLFQRPSQNPWEVVIHPVPREMRHRSRTYLHDSALPQIRTWLDQQSRSRQRGHDIFAFFFDEKLDQFTTRQLSHVEPQIIL